MKGKLMTVLPDGVNIPTPAKQKTYPRLRLDQTEGGVAVFESQNWSRVRGTFGVESDDVADGLLRQIINAKAGKALNEGDANFALGAVQGIKPTDTVEALLAAQMVAIHAATMAAADRLGRAESILQHDTNLNALTKLARTFTAQVEALKRHRSKGEQRVYVERVDVQPGGQAVVGAVRTGGGH